MGGIAGQTRTATKDVTDKADVSLRAAGSDPQFAPFGVRPRISRISLPRGL